jgi:hypothetical protein
MLLNGTPPGTRSCRRRYWSSASYSSLANLAADRSIVLNPRLRTEVTA